MGVSDLQSIKSTQPALYLLVLLQMWAAYESIEQMINLYSVSLFVRVRVELRTSSGKRRRRVQGALCVTEVICLVNRRLESSITPR